MKLFPAKKYTVELLHNSSQALTALKQHTKLADTLVSSWTHKAFIGQVDENGFKIISSAVGRGAVCVFIGAFQGKKGTIALSIHPAFKVLFTLLMTLPFVGFGLLMWQSGFENFMGSLLLMITHLLFIRFILIELGFRFIARTGLNKLHKTIGIKKLEEVKKA